VLSGGFTRWLCELPLEEKGAGSGLVAALRDPLNLLESPVFSTIPEHDDKLRFEQPPILEIFFRKFDANKQLSESIFR